MQSKNIQLILGSQSPRRKELLQYTYLPFSIETSSIDEISDKKDPTEFVLDIAQQKAQAVFSKIKSKYNNPLVLGADTIVCTGGEILGKPKDEQQAREMLISLSGKSHEVLTGVSLISKERSLCFYEMTTVIFEDITEDLLSHYIATKESLDKAGAYGIQAYSLGFISKVDGSYSNVVGLPVNLVIKNIKKIIGQSNDSEGKWRKYFE